MNRNNRRGTLLGRLQKLRQHTEVIGQILIRLSLAGLTSAWDLAVGLGLRHLWPLGVVISSILGVALHQFG